MMRIALFLATNFAVLSLVSIIFQLLGFNGVLKNNGVDLDLQALLVMSALIGFSGSFISLALSKWIAKRTMKVRVIEQAANQDEQWLLDTVTQQSKQASIGMPEVGIFDSADPNAFATGINRNNALVAVSSGLLKHMSKNEVEAVLAHEVSHVSNGDMITLGLIQGVVNTFVVFLSRVIGFIVDRVVFKTKSGLGIGYYITSIVAQVCLSILATAIVMWFSRWREFHADKGAAELVGADKMIAALKRLQNVHQPHDLPGEFASFGISGGKGAGIKALFTSHPPLQQRIQALEQLQVQVVVKRR
jgi:heat shock protein HtpX